MPEILRTSLGFSTTLGRRETPTHCSLGPEFFSVQIAARRNGTWQRIARELIPPNGDSHHDLIKQSRGSNYPLAPHVETVFHEMNHPAEARRMGPSSQTATPFQQLLFSCPFIVSFGSACSDSAGSLPMAGTLETVAPKTCMTSRRFSPPYPPPSPWRTQQKNSSKSAFPKAVSLSPP